MLVDMIMGSAEKAFGPLWRTHADLRSVVRARARRFQDDLAKLGADGLTKDQLRARTYWLARSFDARFVSLIMGWPSYAEPVSLAEAETMAFALDARRDCGEPIHAYAKPKLDGYRIICVFGPQRRGLQCLAREILKAILGTSIYDYAQCGLGRDRAMAKIVGSIEQKGGPRWFLTSDIKNCFGSFDREGVVKMVPLPRSMTENCLLIPETATILMDKTLSNHTTSQIAVRAGFPQGSLSSSYLASKLLEPVIDELKSKLKVGFADDILVGNATQAEAEANKQALHDLLLSHPAGPLLMKISVVERLGKPVDFLGYRIRRRWSQYGGGVRLTPSPAAFAKYRATLTRHLQKSSIAHMDEVAGSYRSVWSSSYRLWDRSAAGDDLLWMHTVQEIIPPIRTQKMKAAKLGIYAEKIDLTYT